MVVVEKNINEALEPIKEDVKELKNSMSKLLEIMAEFKALEERINYNKESADEARKVIHKRIDKLEHDTIKNKDFMIKIIVGVGSVAITTLLGILLGVVKL